MIGFSDRIQSYSLMQGDSTLVLSYGFLRSGLISEFKSVCSYFDPLMTELSFYSLSQESYCSFYLLIFYLSSSNYSVLIFCFSSSIRLFSCCFSNLFFSISFYFSFSYSSLTFFFSSICFSFSQFFFTLSSSIYFLFQICGLNLRQVNDADI